MEISNPTKQHEVCVAIQKSYQWQDFREFYLKPKLEGIWDEIRRTYGDKEKQDRLLGQVEAIDNLVKLDNVIKDLSVYMKLGHNK